MPVLQCSNPFSPCLRRVRIYRTIDVKQIIPPRHGTSTGRSRGWDFAPAVLVPLGVRENKTIDQGTRIPRIYTPVLLVDLRRQT